MSGAVVTGSRVYGTPTEDSDYDLVVLVTPEEMALLAGIRDERTDEEYGSRKSIVLREGRLNLIVTICPIRFAVWLQGTKEMIASKAIGGPLKREEAVEVLKDLRNRHGVPSYRDNIETKELQW